MSDVNCLNPWDPQTIRQYGVDGVSPALSANNVGGMSRSGICYAVYPGVSITSANSGSNPQPGDPYPTLVNDSRYYLVGVRENDR